MMPRLNHSGNVFIGALIFLAMSVGFMVMVPQIQNVNLVQMKTSRARAVMSTQEIKLRAVLMEPSTFPTCVSGNRAQCTFDANKINVFRFARVPGCSGSSNPNQCGVLLTNEAFNSSTLTFTARFTYTGTDTHLKDSPVTFSLPPEVLQPKQIACSGTQPFFFWVCG